MAAAGELLKKLQVKAGARLWLINVPQAVADDLSAAAGVVLVQTGEAFDGALAYCENPGEVASMAASILPGLPTDGLLWFAYRKGAAGKSSGLTRDVGWGALEAAGYRPIRSIALDDDWTGLRFRPLTLIKSRTA